MAASLPIGINQPFLYRIDEGKGNSELVEYVPAAELSGNLHPLMQLMVVAEKEHNAQTEETALALQKFLAESKQRVKGLLEEIGSLQEQLVKAESRNQENELLLRAQIVAKDQELAIRAGEVQKLTLQIRECEERSNQRVNALLAEKNEAVSNAVKAGKIAEQTATKAGETAVHAIKAQMAAMQAGQNAKLQEAEARIGKINAEKLAAEQTAASQIAELKLQNAKLQRYGGELEQSIRNTFEFHCQPVQPHERVAMEAGFKKLMEDC